VVDDEPLVRSMARDILLGAGYRVLEAADGEQALRVAEEHPGAIQVLLTDVVLPGINGKELAARMAALRPETRCSSCPAARPRWSARPGSSSRSMPFWRSPSRSTGYSAKCASGSRTAHPFPVRPQVPDLAWPGWARCGGATAAARPRVVYTQTGVRGSLGARRA
jgi:Response regulator receiver domain